MFHISQEIEWCGLRASGIRPCSNVILHRNQSTPFVFLDKTNTIELTHTNSFSTDTWVHDYRKWKKIVKNWTFYYYFVNLWTVIVRKCIIIIYFLGCLSRWHGKPFSRAEFYTCEFFYHHCSVPSYRFPNETFNRSIVKKISTRSQCSFDAFAYVCSIVNE